MKYGILLFLFSAFTLNCSANFQIMLELQVQKSKLMQELEDLEQQNLKFITALGLRESNMNPRIINPIGAMGAWQFMPATLRDLGLGHITPESFTTNPDIFPLNLQIAALERKFHNDLSLLQYQWFRAENSINYLDVYLGRTINGIRITLSGLLAACHIAGVGGVIKFLDSDGYNNPADMFGTRLSDYLREFAEYEYSSTYSIKSEIKCLKDSLKTLQSLILSLEISRWSTSMESIRLRDMEIALISHYPTPLTLEYVEALHTFRLGLRSSYQSIIVESWLFAALPQNTIRSSYLTGTERLNGTMRMSGVVQYISPVKQPMLPKELDYFSFILNRCGTLHGMSTFFTYSQNTELWKWTDSPLIVVESDTQVSNTII